MLRPRASLHHFIFPLQMCDADSKIIAVCCRFGGSASSAYIWNKMNIRPFIESISRQGEMSWIIG